MRNKELVINKLERVDSYLKKLNFYVNTNDQRSAKESIISIKELNSDILIPKLKTKLC
jgi:hypothetical protein